MKADFKHAIATNNVNAKHLISAEQFADRKSLETFFVVTDALAKKEFAVDYPAATGSEYGSVRGYYTSRAVNGCILATLFLEPSTRTRLSFESAMHQMNGKVITVDSPLSSSISKGESVEDMVATVSNYADLIVLRTPLKGEVERAAKVSQVPVINAGDGIGEHPTQALLDVYTISKHRSLDNLKVMVSGDLLNGRTVHSLVRLLATYDNLTLFLASPDELSLPDELVIWLRDKKVNVLRYGCVKDALAEQPDVVYMTRLQKERMSVAELERLYGLSDQADRWRTQFRLTKEGVESLPKDSLVLHPMPRNDEILPDVDADPRCLYLTEQPVNGVLIRKALIYSIVNGNIPYTTWR